MKALLTRARIEDHPDPTVRGKIGHVAGRQVFTTGTPNNALVLFIPAGSQLSHEFTMSQDLYAKHPDTGAKMGGYLEANRRVRVIKLKGVESEGFILPIDELRNGVSLLIDQAVPRGAEQWVEVDTLMLDGKRHRFIDRYVTPAAKKAIASGKQHHRMPTETNFFRRHYDTGQWSRNGRHVPQHALLYITEKLHGTSGRVGYCLSEELPRRTTWQRLLGLFGLGPKPVTTWRYFNGTRNTIIHIGDKPTMPANTKAENYRVEWFNRIAPFLRRGETVYFEIVGAGVQKGFDYGCKPRETKAFIYRITVTNPDGVVTELSWQQVVGRAEQFGIPTVPTLKRCFYFGFGGDLIDKRIQELSVGNSTIDGATHIREGVCIRIESPKMMKALKHKSFAFLQHEDKTNSDDSHVDIEEVS